MAGTGRVPLDLSPARFTSLRSLGARHGGHRARTCRAALGDAGWLDAASCLDDKQRRLGTGSAAQRAQLQAGVAFGPQQVDDGAPHAHVRPRVSGPGIKRTCCPLRAPVPSMVDKALDAPQAARRMLSTPAAFGDGHQTAFQAKASAGNRTGRRLRGSLGYGAKPPPRGVGRTRFEQRKPGEEEIT